MESQSALYYRANDYAIFMHSERGARSLPGW